MGFPWKKWRIYASFLCLEPLPAMSERKIEQKMSLFTVLICRRILLRQFLLSVMSILYDDRILGFYGFDPVDDY
jgi:hypothetical protein